MRQCKAIALVVRNRPCNALWALIFIFVFACYIGWPTAQAREPDLRIDQRGEFKFSADGDYLVFMVVGHVERYDLARRRFDQKIALPPMQISPSGTRLAYFMTDIALNSPGNRLVHIDSARAEVRMIDFESGDVLHTLPYPFEYVSVLHEISFVGDNPRMVVLNHDRGLAVTDFKSGTWNTISIAGSWKFLAISESRCLVVIGHFNQVAVTVA